MSGCTTKANCTTKQVRLIKTEIAELSHLVFVNVMKVFTVIKVFSKGVRRM